jgi:hypothetical protein
LLAHHFVCNIGSEIVNSIGLELHLIVLRVLVYVFLMAVIVYEVLIISISSDRGMFV